MRPIAPILVAALALAGCPSKEEVIKKAEETGKFVVEKNAALVKGAGEGLKGEGKQGAQALGEGVGEVVKGTAKGIDKSLGVVALDVAPDFTHRGLRAERGSKLGSGKGITIYFIYDQPFTGRLTVRALDDAGKEVGRASAEVKQPAGAAGYTDFQFDERTPLEAVAKYAVDAG